MEKQISVFIGRTTFFIIFISILIGRRVGKGAKGLFGFCVKKKSFSNKKHEAEKRTALNHYLGQITKK